jgi:hypothetical protein
LAQGDHPEQLSDDDHRVLAALGYAVARAQLFELALKKLLEVQQHDLNVPLEDRWPEILEWMTKWTAGRAAKELQLPEEVASDLVNLVAGRNQVVHNAWLIYVANKDLPGRDKAADESTAWLDEQARRLGLAHDALMALVDFGRAGLPMDLTGEEAVPTWRHFLTEPVGEVDPPKV